jgi:hypothetical protein
MFMPRILSCFYLSSRTGRETIHVGNPLIVILCSRKEKKFMWTIRSCFLCSRIETVHAKNQFSLYCKFKEGNHSSRKSVHAFLMFKVEYSSCRESVLSLSKFKERNRSCRKFVHAFLNFQYWIPFMPRIRSCQEYVLPLFKFKEGKPFMSEIHSTFFNVQCTICTCQESVLALCLKHGGNMFMRK